MAHLIAQTLGQDVLTIDWAMSEVGHKLVLEAILMDKFCPSPENTITSALSGCLYPTPPR